MGNGNGHPGIRAERVHKTSAAGKIIMTTNASTIIKGIIAGFVATVVLTLFMMLKKAMGVMPELDPVHMIADMATQNLGIEPNIIIGWVLHFGIGSVAWGVGFVILNNILPGSGQIAKGIAMGIAAWLLMMVATMPMAGAGLFGMSMGVMAPILTLILHLIFGLALGFTFKKLIGSRL
jgi:hypothetical protein